MSKISVIVPVYKVESYLHRCVDSILNQTFTDFELILVDDGSPDNCGAICDEYVEKDNRVIVIHQENGGLSAARNAGIDWSFANSDSRWLTFIDSDDWVHPQYLEILYQMVITYNTTISVCDAIHVTNNKTDGITYCETYVLNSLDAFTEKYGLMICACAKLYNKKCFESIRYPIGKLHEDAFTTYKIVFETEKIAINESTLYYYYYNENSITHSSWHPKRLDEIEAHEEQLSFLKEKNYLAALNREYLAYIYVIASQIVSIRSFHNKYYYYEKPLKKKLRMAIKEANRYSSFSIKKHEWIYEIAYPRIMTMYWYHIVLIKRGIRVKHLFKNIYTKIIKLMDDRKFNDYLSIVAIAKHEECYIKEWVEYHLLQGIDRIYLYDNESPDTMKEQIQKYIDNGKVVYKLIAGRGRQLDAYNDAVQKYKHKTKYMAFIDIDEFIVQEDHTKTLLESIDEIYKSNRNAGGVAVNWRMYGSSGYIAKPDGLVTENYLYRSNWYEKGNDCYKTIANPRLIKRYSHDHYPQYIKGFYNVDENGQIVDNWSNPCETTKHIRINHYFTKSKEEWIIRRGRGKADTTDENDKRTLAEFYEHDHNDIYDPIMLPYVELLKERIKNDKPI